MLVAGLKHVALLDGPLSDSEREIILRATNTIWPKEMEGGLTAHAIWQLIEQTEIDEQACAGLLAAAMADPAVAQLLLYHATQVCAADAKLAITELKWLAGLARASKLPSELLELHRLQFFGDEEREPTIPWQEALDRMGLPASASEDLIRTRHKELCKKHHPDRHHTAAESVKQEHATEFKRIHEAFASLISTLTWAGYCRSAASPTLTKAAPELAAGCFHCITTVALPKDHDSLKSARCPNCKALLVHGKDSAEIMLAFSAERVPATVLPPRPAVRSPRPRAFKASHRPLSGYLWGSAIALMVVLAIWRFGSAAALVAQPTRIDHGAAQLDQARKDFAASESRWRTLAVDAREKEWQVQRLQKDLADAQEALVSLPKQETYLRGQIALSETRLKEHRQDYDRALHALNQWQSENPDIQATATETAGRTAELHLSRSLQQIEDGFQERQELRRRSGARPADQAELQSLYNKRKQAKQQAEETRALIFRKTVQRLTEQKRKLAADTQRHQRSHGLESDVLAQCTRRLKQLPEELAANRLASEILPAQIEMAQSELLIARASSADAMQILLATKRKLASLSSSIASR